MNIRPARHITEPDFENQPAARAVEQLLEDINTAMVSTTVIRTRPVSSYIPRHIHNRLFCTRLPNKSSFCRLSHQSSVPSVIKMKASLFLFSVLAAFAAAKSTTDVANNKPSPTVQDNSKTIERRVEATHEADSTSTVKHNKANTSIEKRAESTGEVEDEE